MLRMEDMLRESKRVTKSRSEADLTRYVQYYQQWAAWQAQSGGDAAPGSSTPGSAPPPPPSEAPPPPPGGSAPGGPPGGGGYSAVSNLSFPSFIHATNTNKVPPPPGM